MHDLFSMRPDTADVKGRLEWPHDDVMDLRSLGSFVFPSVDKSLYGVTSVESLSFDCCLHSINPFGRHNITTWWPRRYDFHTSSYLTVYKTKMFIDNKVIYNLTKLRMCSFIWWMFISWRACTAHALQCHSVSEVGLDAQYFNFQSHRYRWVMLIHNSGITHCVEHFLRCVELK